MRVDRIHEAIYRIWAPFEGGGTAFSYLLKGDTVALVDTGAAGAPGGFIQPALASLGMAMSDVELILNTHAHPDHSGGNLEAKGMTNAPIYVHSADLLLAQSTEAMVEFFTAPLRALDFSPQLLQRRSNALWKIAGEAAGADVVLSEGDVVDLGAGIKLRVVHCPGHSPGSIAYFWESEGVLLVGDIVQGQGARPGCYPSYFDAPAYRRSLTALAGLDFRLLCMAHAYLGGGPISDATRIGAEGKALIRESMQIADTIHRAVGEVMGQKPSASKREIALDALAALVCDVPQLLVRETRMPRTAGPTLVAHMAAVQDGSYPA